MLIFLFQKELAASKNAIASTIRHGVTKTDAINTPTIVSDIRRNALKSSKDVRGQGLRVSTIRPPPVAER